MSYLIAAGIGLVLGCVLTVILLQPSFLARYERVNDIAAKNWKAAQRAKEAYMNEEDDTQEAESDEEQDEEQSE